MHLTVNLIRLLGFSCHQRKKGERAYMMISASLFCPDTLKLLGKNKKTVQQAGLVVFPSECIFRQNNRSPGRKDFMWTQDLLLTRSIGCWTLKVFRSGRLHFRSERKTEILFCWCMLFMDVLIKHIVAEKSERRDLGEVFKRAFMRMMTIARL